MIAWESPAHATEYNYLAAAPEWLRTRFYDRYPEMHAFPATVTSILEVGCATGEAARYLLARYPHATYTGYDVSPGAIVTARMKQLRGVFKCGRFQDDQPTAQVVFCRDVIHHQADPWTFLDDLYQATEQFLIVRLRITEKPSYNRTQILYGQTVPYWLLNQQALADWSSGKKVALFDKEEPPLALWLRAALWWYR